MVIPGVTLDSFIKIIAILQAEREFLWDLYQRTCNKRSHPGDDMTRFQKFLRNIYKELDQTLKV